MFPKHGINENIPKYEKLKTKNQIPHENLLPFGRWKKIRDVWFLVLFLAWMRSQKFEKKFTPQWTFTGLQWQALHMRFSCNSHNHWLTTDIWTVYTAHSFPNSLIRILDNTLIVDYVLQFTFCFGFLIKWTGYFCSIGLRKKNTLKDVSFRWSIKFEYSKNARKMCVA